MTVAPAQIHAQQHLRPVLGLGAAGAGLDVQEGVVGVHLAREHAAKFEVRHLDLIVAQVAHHGGNRLIVLLGHRQIQQFPGFVETGIQFSQGQHHRLQGGALASQGLGQLGPAPDIRLFEFPLDLDQTLGFVIEVKDTPSGTGRVP